jgi:hypothetical protein
MTPLKCRLLMPVAALALPSVFFHAATDAVANYCGINVCSVHSVFGSWYPWSEKGSRWS